MMLFNPFLLEVIEIKIPNAAAIDKVLKERANNELNDSFKPSNAFGRGKWKNALRLRKEVLQMKIACLAEQSEIDSSITDIREVEAKIKELSE